MHDRGSNLRPSVSDTKLKRSALPIQLYNPCDIEEENDLLSFSKHGLRDVMGGRFLLPCHIGGCHQSLPRIVLAISADVINLSQELSDRVIVSQLICR
jgi:hypothetical protein